MRSTFRGNRSLRAQIRQAADEALLAAADVVREEVVRRFAERGGGFKDGTYASSPPRAADIKVSGTATRDGVRRVSIYTDATRSGRDGEHPYPSYWEFGHQNVFTGRYERVETFRPALEAVSGKLPDVMLRQFRRASQRMGTAKTGLEAGFDLGGLG